LRKTLLLPAAVGIAMLLGCAGAILAALASAPTASAASIDHGASFAVRCNFSHRNYDDPIKLPGQPGLSHRHDFFGNTSTNASSTYQSMTAKGATTTCSRPEDTAGYWIPTVSWKDSDGTQTELTANRAVFYYRAGNKDYRTVKPFAPDLRDLNATRITWYCGTSDTIIGSATPPTQCSSGVLGLKIIFPDCVAKVSTTKGQQLDSADHASHMTPSILKGGTRVCPSTHPIPVPTLTVNINFPMPTTVGTVQLSSGDASSIHADFWNTWNQDEPLNLNPPDGRSYGGLKALVKHCINEVPPSQPRPLECRAPTATA
jgi:Domain of unknown function (DUF1996)